MTLAEFLATGDNRELKFEQLPFSHPLYILYSSGTSGKPKCIVHSAGVRFIVLHRAFFLMCTIGCLIANQERHSCGSGP